MTIGLPKALLYYRYGVLWDTFFRGLDCGVITSGDTGGHILENGAHVSAHECCLPSKLYMGHVRELLGKCDYILQPCFKRVSDDEKNCVRFYGLYDVVKNTYRDAPLLDYIVEDGGYREFYRMGRRIGCKRHTIAAAYEAAVLAQRFADTRAEAEQEVLLKKTGLKLLIAAQPYIIHDPYIGAPIKQLIEEQGVIPLFSDRCGRELCLFRAGEIAPRLYWTSNMESIGAIAAYRASVDGVLLLTAFPCGSDSLTGEMAVRRVRDVPVIQILVDGLTGDAGLRTRIESFIDIIRERKHNVRKNA